MEEEMGVMLPVKERKERAEYHLVDALSSL